MVDAFEFDEAFDYLSKESPKAKDRRSSHHSVDGHMLTLSCKYVYLYISSVFRPTCTSIYPGLSGAVIGETALFHGLDCDAVWFCPRRMKTPIVSVLER